MKNIYLIVFFVLSCLSQRLVAGNEKTPITFTFKEYQYKDTTKNDIIFREFETACEQGNTCSHLGGLARLLCVRECISPSCFREIYHPDQLEEGEIDVRLNSFKGCFIQRTGRTRN